MKKAEFRKLIREEIKKVISEAREGDYYDLRGHSDDHKNQIFKFMDSVGYKYEYFEIPCKLRIYDVSEASNRDQDAFMELLGKLGVRR